MTVRDSFQVTADAAGKHPRTRRTRSAEVVVSRVDARVWATALELAEGDVSRLIVRSETAVTVR